MISIEFRFMKPLFLGIDNSIHFNELCEETKRSI